MSKHTEPPASQPAAGGGDPDCIDLVAGDPPVPITVWRTARGGDDQSPTITARLAYRLVAAYSRPGEAVIDLTDNHVLTAACLRGARRHHRAWFTDVASLIVGPSTPPDPIDPDAGDGDAGEPPALAVWFGDDLVDPYLPPVGDAPVALSDDGRVRAATSLVVASWPLDVGDAANRVRLAWLLAVCARLLRRGGCLVLVVGVPAGRLAAPEDFSPVVAAASGAGLGYLQHIVAVAADTGGDEFTYYATDEELLALAHARGRWLVHVRVHADLLVFTPVVAGGGANG